MYNFQAPSCEREWTRSEHVKRMFDTIYDVCESREAYSYDDGTRGIANWNPGSSVGYINSKGGRKAFGESEYDGTIENGWDIRCAIPYNIRGTAPVEEYHTDYASTIFIIDNPAILDVLIATGHYKMPKSSAGEVFLALSPTFVESHSEVSNIIDDAKADGEVFDIRDWYASGLIEHAEHAHWKHAVNWMGEMPDEIAEMKLASRLSDIVSSARGTVITGYNSDKWGRVKDVNDCLNIANALALDSDFITLPTIAKGKKISTSGKWAKFESSHKIFFMGEGYSEKMQEISDKLDELDDIVRFWRRARNEYRFSILLDEKDFHNKEFVFEKISVLGRLIGVDDYVETYKFGVPADDILA